MDEKGRRVQLSEQEFARAVGRNIRQIRERRGLHQDQLSERTGLSVNTISRTETGHNKPSVLTLVRIAKGLDVEIEELLPDPKEGALETLRRQPGQFGEFEIRLGVKPEEAGSGQGQEESVEPEVVTKTRDLFWEFRQGTLTLNQLEQGVVEILWESASSRSSR